MRRSVVVGLVAGLMLSAAPAVTVAVAAPGEPTYPSQAEVDRARSAQDDVAAAVTAAEGRLAAVDDELNQLYVRSAKAVEAYNGARLALEQAEAAERSAREHAGRTAAAAEQARLELGRLAAASYANGGGIASLGMILNAADDAALYDGIAALKSVTEGQAGVYDRAARTKRAAEQAAVAADEALAEWTRAVAEAERTFDAARDAVARQETALAAVEAERTTLLTELAAARGTTVALEEARQQGIADEEAAERERQAREDLPDDVNDGNQPVVDPPVADPTPSPSPPPPPEPSPTPTPSASPTPTPTPTPTKTDPPPPPPPDPPSGADVAIDYARAQLGKPYEWGADGPDSFDCSGLTMRAWEAGGVSLPHWSVAQAQAVSRVSYSDLLPGDLIFWSDNGSASGVYHVGLYIGGGQMIHAPRAGKPVEVQDVFYWIDPAFYGRV